MEIIVLLALLLILKNKKVGSFKKQLSAVKSKAVKEYGADKAKWIMSQILHETGAKQSPLAKLNNLSGITFNHQRLALDSGIALPENKAFTYAKYKTVSDWFMDYSRIVDKSLRSAKSLYEYAENLKKQGYYTADLEDYRKALIWFNNNLNKYV